MMASTLPTASQSMRPSSKIAVSVIAAPRVRVMATWHSSINWSSGSVAWAVIVSAATWAAVAASGPWPSPSMAAISV
jgi:hypothetical protein